MLSEIGNTSTNVYGQIANEAVVLKSYTIINKTGGTVGANLGIKRSGVTVNIIPKDTQIYPGAMYPYGQICIPITMNGGDQVVLLVTGNVDYTFSYSLPNR